MSGNTNSKVYRLNQLSDDLEKRLERVFKKMDTDGSKTIDKTETLKYW
jgi:hypothetical protein